MRWQAGVLVLGGLAMLGPVASAFGQPVNRPMPQPRSEITIYRDADFSGPAVFADGERPNLGLAWPVNSIRITSGSWQLCERPNFRGTCRVYSETRPRLQRGGGVTVQSMRPLGSGTGGGNLAPGNNPSLRGMAAEFFPAPAVDGRRVLACASGPASRQCMERTAARFCNQRGWRLAVRVNGQTVQRQTYLADVLCANSQV
ncbi:beta/gamma crystallin-related protein [Alteraurantiacibacter palmitatis]|uniref:Beta/gamma crystallin-related protein n=1 Tax=Alteraurantiacibacter palmitatis TaxID=2054628 RepID=A0ABV7E1E7_9SPHN